MFDEFLLKLETLVEWDIMLEGAIRLLLITILWWVATKVAARLFKILNSRLVERELGCDEPASEQQKRVETLTRLLGQGVNILLTSIALLVFLKEIGLDIGPILASAGVVGLAVGFGAQNLVRDIISGFFLILENQVRVGDVATINGTGGLVEQVNFRTLILRDLSGTKHIFPNGEIKTIANLTSEWSANVFEIGVAYKEDPNHVIRVMQDVGQAMREDPNFSRHIIEDFEIFGVDSFADSAIIIKGRVKTRPIQQWTVGREYRKRLKIRFGEEGISIPFPQRDLYIKTVPEEIKAQLQTFEGKPYKTPQSNDPSASPASSTAEHKPQQQSPNNLDND